MIYERGTKKGSFPTKLTVLGGLAVAGFYYKDKVINFIDGIFNGERDVEEDGRWKHETENWRGFFDGDVRTASVKETKYYRVL